MRPEPSPAGALPAWGPSHPGQPGEACCACAELLRTVTCQGHSPSSQSRPPTIRMTLLLSFWCVWLRSSRLEGSWVGGRLSKALEAGVVVLGTASLLLAAGSAALFLRPSVSFPQGKASERSRAGPQHSKALHALRLGRRLLGVQLSAGLTSPRALAEVGCAGAAPGKRTNKSSRPGVGEGRSRREAGSGQSEGWTPGGAPHCFHFAICLRFPLMTCGRTTQAGRHMQAA